MVSFKPRSLCFYSVVFILLVFNSFADARLVRGGGRGGITVSFGTLDLLVPMSAINDFSLLDYSYYDSMPSEDRVGIIPPSYPMVQGVPDDCFEPLSGDEPFVDDPCYWEFSETEQTLEFLGSTVSHFENAIQNITWQIYPANVSVFSPTATPLYEFDNSHTTVNPLQYAGNMPHKTLAFSAPMPAGIAPGEYQVLLTMEQTAPDGWVFYSGDTISNLDEACLGDPGNIQCSLLGNIRGTTFTQSALERMVVVSTPQSIGIFSIIFLLIMRMRAKNTT
ncbi:hypothetical protein [Glaciecola sp. 1036]|uniref:hypothetical protein n=1 Tax=Alteromonadaceae TaxID=72275 RepID=UPI003CFF4B2C